MSFEMDVDTTEWDAICRICLQEGQMNSIFDYDDEKSDIHIADKIMLCSSIDIKAGGNLPEQICSFCLVDLSVAYKFRKNCERSDAILQSFVDSTVETIVDDAALDDYSEDTEPNEEKFTAADSSVMLSSNTGTVYEYRPPVGLNVKRVRGDTTANTRKQTPAKQLQKRVVNKQSVLIKNEPAEEIYDEERIDDTFSDSEQIQSDFNDSLGGSDKEIVSKKSTPIVIRKANQNKNGSESKLMQIKHVKTNKARLGFSATKKQQKVQAKKLENVSPIRKQSKEQKEPKTCQICGNSYKYQHALESHMRRHRNEKPFECSVCGKGFVINFELNRHMRTHTGQKPYACKYCDRRFSDFGSRVKHERTHTGERPYSCDICGKTFAYSHVLSSHNLIHTGEKKYHCEICGKRFTKSHHLKAHLNTHTKQNAQKTQQLKLQQQQQSQQHQHQQDLQESQITPDLIAIDNNDNELAEYINITREDIVAEQDDDPLNAENDNQILLYSNVDVDVDVLQQTIKSQNIVLKRQLADKPHIIEDEDGVQYEITIAEHQDAIELPTFEDDELE